jgi:hypothetical protein
MSKSHRNKFSDVSIQLGDQDKARISAKIIFKKDKSDHQHSFVELNFTSRNSNTHERIPIPAHLEVPGGEKLLEKIEQLNQVFINDLESVWKAVEQYHFAKTGEKPNIGTDLRFRNASKRLYASIAHAIFHEYKEGLRRAMNQETLDTCMEFLDSMSGGVRADYIQHARETIKKDEMSYPYVFDALENDLQQYSRDMEGALGSIKHFLSARYQLMAGANVNDDMRHKQLDDARRLIKITAALNEPIYAFEDAWLESAIDIHGQDYVALQDARGHKKSVQQAIESAQQAYADFKRDIDYFPKSQGSVENPRETVHAMDMLDEVETLLDDMHDRAEILGEPLKMRDTIAKVAYKSSRHQ